MGAADGRTPIEVLAGLTPQAGVRYAVLVPNMRGWEGFLAARRADMTTEIAVFISASEGFSQSNLNCSIAEVRGSVAPCGAGRVRGGRDGAGIYLLCH